MRLLACVLALLFACDKNDSKQRTTTSSATPSAQTASSAAATPTSAPITSTTKGPVGRLPDNWPADVPIYPGATLGASEVSTRGTSVTMQTKDGPEKVAAFYESSLTGMTKGQEIGTGPLKTVSFKDDKRSVTVMAMASSGALGGGNVPSREGREGREGADSPTQVTVTVLMK